MRLRVLTLGVFTLTLALPASAVLVARPATAAAPAQDQEPYPNAVRVGGDIKEPKKIKDAKPVYPQEARDAQIQGIVILEAVIDPAGKVVRIKVLRGQALLDQAAINAVAQWEYTPTLLNGEPVAVVMTVTVNFTLS